MFFKWSPAPPVKRYCSGCEAKENEIGYLRQHVDELLDRIMGMLGLFQAQKEALAVPLEPDNARPAPTTEVEAIEQETEDQDALFAAAERELKEHAKEAGVDPLAYQDIR